MDFVEVMQNNIFLDKCFPEGFPKETGLIKLNIVPDNKADFCLEVTKKPGITVKKWGVWGRDYNAMLLHFYGEINSVTVDRFGLGRSCDLKVSGSKESFTTAFHGKNVHVKMEFKYIFYEKGIPVLYDDYALEII